MAQQGVAIYMVSGFQLLTTAFLVLVFTTRIALAETWIARVSPSAVPNSSIPIYVFSDGDVLVRFDPSSLPDWKPGEWIANRSIRYLYPDIGLAGAGSDSPNPDSDSDEYQNFLLQDGFLELPDSQRHCESVPIAIIDSGVNLDHPRLSRVQFASPYDAIANSEGGYDGFGHGTHLAGLIAASDNGNWSGACVGATLIPVRFLSNTGGGRVSDAIEGIHWAVEAGAKVINHSWTVTNPNPALLDVLEDADSRGIIQVAAAGNLGEDLDISPVYPVGYASELEHLMAVANWDQAVQALYSGSNYGLRSVDIAASGTNLLSLSLSGEDVARTGTSMAAPLVSAAVAMNWARYPEDQAADQRARLLAGCQPSVSLSANVRCGGRLNAAKAQSAAAIAVWRMILDDASESLSLSGRGLSQVEEWRFFSWVSADELTVEPVSENTDEVVFEPLLWPPGEWRFYRGGKLLGRYPYRPQPEIPAHLAAVPNDDGILLSWAGDIRATDYIIEFEHNLSGFQELERIDAPMNQYLHAIPAHVDSERDLLRYRVKSVISYVDGGRVPEGENRDDHLSHFYSANSEPLVLNAGHYVWQIEAFATVPVAVTEARFPITLPEPLDFDDLTLTSGDDVPVSLENQHTIVFRPQSEGDVTFLMNYQSSQLDSERVYTLSVREQEAWTLPLWGDESISAQATNGDITAFQRLVDGRVRLDLTDVSADTLISIQLYSPSRQLDALPTRILGDNTSGTRIRLQSGSNVLLYFAPEETFDGDVALVFQPQLGPRQATPKEDSRCFIASVLLRHHPRQLDILRGFRDEILLTSEPGRWLVESYYHHSPAIAHYLDQHPTLSDMLAPALITLSDQFKRWGVVD